ncbi:hypothetical protein GFS31_25810 [Leptolyngbya sp. BL0902]|uniref:hypothetical protein n=1 Tax=Leptolyngbya sp. BL0902 TaxID=1115757 RepID=UPI0018E8012F|nr:hypothetical protein [Leptolyngbya sp. BL0902]QQE65889.1 hypothetical protein GFS31_25810 [Leptolyngbya sp. BL0902]
MVNQSQSVPPAEGAGAAPDLPFDGLGGSLGDAFKTAREMEAYLAIPEVIQHPPQPKNSGKTVRPPASGHFWRWLLLSILSCVATSAAAVGALLWLVNLPPTTNCDDPAQITTDRAALSCAEMAAVDGDLESVLAGLTLVQSWGPNHWLSHEIDPLVEAWSAVVVTAAAQELRQGRRDEAERLIAHIPSQSAAYPLGQNLLAEWNQEWEVGAALVAKAQEAMANQDWQAASAQMLALGELSHPHWREEQVQAVARQIQGEQQAHAQIRRAVALASSGGADRLMEASGLVSQVAPDTIAHKTAQTYLDRWSDLLLTEALQRWYNADLDRAIQISQSVSRNPNRAKAAQELIWLSQARQLARDSVGPWRVTPQQMTAIYQAMLLANRLPSDSPYYPQAQSSVATWRTHLAGMGTLQLAQLPGGIHQVGTLKLAIQQAEMIPADHPRRVQAQTLMAHWRQSLERLEDAPYLRQAHQQAKTNTPEGLRQAIASASQIHTHRALRGEAQSWIYVWTNRLQTLEDQPILDRARQLAEEGKLSQAVAEASSIRPGRSLYDEAQSAVIQWQRTITAQEQHRYAPPPRPATLPLAVEPASLTPPASPLTPGVPPQRVAPAAVRPSPPAQPAAPVSPPTAPVPRTERPSVLPTRIETVPADDLPVPTSPAAPPRPLAAPSSVEGLPSAPPVLTAPPPTSPPVMAPPPGAITQPPPAPPAPPTHEPTSQEGASLPSSHHGGTSSAHPDAGPEVIYTGALYAGW